VRGDLARLAFAGAVAWAAAACAPPAPRNLILVSIDTLRADRLGCYGYARPTSPALDRLAARGVLFEQALSPAPWTVPAHASLLTGREPRSHHVRTARGLLDPAIPTLAQWLAARGYDTAAIVNTHFLDSRRGLTRGFAHLSTVPEAEGTGSAAQRVHELALRWLAASHERPFFLFLHHYDVHGDYAPEPAYRAMFTSPYDGPATGTTLQLGRVRRGELKLRQRDARHLSDLYDAGIRQLDDELGRFLARLERAGKLDDTLLVVTSDHGEEFLEHGDVFHGRTLYSELVRVPLLVSGPGVPRGRRVAVPVSLVDVVPTASALLGVPPPPGVEGRDVGPAWRGGADSGDGRSFGFAADHWMAQAPGAFRRAVQRDGWKLHYSHPEGRLELYDLASDPGELRDVAAEHPERVAELRPALDAWLARGEQGETLELDADEAERLRALGYGD
jgi:arylsulfatase A-like enzyme